jgi:beta-N-acetylhexosaminidase
VAATAKHFPGHGDTASDSHHAAPVIPHGLPRLSRVELPPFKAAIAAGVRLIMTAHIVLPALSGGADLPATLSPAILKDLLRRRLRFKGLVATDAMDMKAIDQGPGLIVDTLAAAAAGVDLMLFNLDPARQVAAYAALVQGARRGLLPAKDIQDSARRILQLKKWLQARRQPPLEVVGCAEHRALARQVAEKSVTLVRDTGKRLPVRLSPEDRIAVVVPRPEDLTPADTSSYLTPALAAAIGRHHPRVDEFFVSMNPAPSDVRSLCSTLEAYDLVVLGTINATAHPAQAALVRAVVKLGTPSIVVALRMPYDLAAYPEVSTYACAYSILPPSMDAMAAALFGKIPFVGRLPVSLPRHLER